MAQREDTPSPIKTKFKISWINICNCIQHEMYPKVASAVRQFINNHSNHNEDEKSLIDLYDLSVESETKLIDFLKTKTKLPLEERTYLRQLIQRARSFKPIPKNHQCTMYYDSSTFLS